MSDYININNAILLNSIPVEEILNSWKYNDNKYFEDILEKDENDVWKGNKDEKNKLYLLPSDQYIQGTNKVYYKAYKWNNQFTELILFNEKVQLNTNNKHEVHFLIDDGDNGLFEIDFDDGHLYYHMELFDNEI